MPRTEFTDRLRCDLTEAEALEQGRKLARLMSEKDDLESQMQAASADYKSQIKAKTSIISRVTEVVKQGYEFREVRCRVEMNVPDKGEKTVFRTDTGAVVRVVPMSDEDFQYVLKLESEEKDAAELEPEPENRVLSTDESGVTMSHRAESLEAEAA